MDQKLFWSIFHLICQQQLEVLRQADVSNKNFQDGFSKYCHLKFCVFNQLSVHFVWKDMTMKKELLTLIALLSFLACNSQSTETKSQHISIGVGLGYGVLQDRYDDGTYAYQFSESLLRPFIFNLRYAWNYNKTRSTFLNASIPFIPELLGISLSSFP